MQPLLDYIREGILPADRVEAHKLQLKAKRYTIVHERLYRRSVQDLFYKKCDKCQQFGNLLHQPAHELYFIAATDYFTKWIEVAPLRTTKENDVQRFIYDHIITRFGLPHNLVTDNGAQFCGSKIKEFYRSHGIQHSLSAPRYAQFNGQAETTNKQVLNNLKKKLDKYKGKWVDELSNVLWAYRSTPRSSTGESPFSLCYGSEAIIPTEIAHPTMRSRIVETEEHRDALEQQVSLLPQREALPQPRDPTWPRSLCGYGFLPHQQKAQQIEWHRSPPWQDPDFASFAGDRWCHRSLQRLRFSRGTAGIIIIRGIRDPLFTISYTINYLGKSRSQGLGQFNQVKKLGLSMRGIEEIRLRIEEWSSPPISFPSHSLGCLDGTDDCRNAIKDLSIGLSIESSNIECLYLRASCYHAIAEYKDAKEIALYTASKFNSEFCWFDIDGDIDPLFKEYWCKRLHPKFVCERVFRQPPLRNSIRKGRIKKQDFVMTKQKSALLQAADLIGKKIQYDCPGFLSNRRQHRMAGLAAIEIAQKVSKAYSKKARRKERIHLLSQNRGGAGCSTSSFSDTSTSYGVTEDRSSGSRCVMSWRDVYALAVKWRQISEPCDPVVWVNKLSEEFNSGFGSHTPLIIGQGKVVRYFPNYQRVLNVAKTFIQEMKYVNNTSDNFIDLTKDGKVQSMLQANSCSDLYNVVGEDFWLATWCNSAAFEGKRLQGTRITLQKMGEQGFDFSIRTPCTPSRWEDYDAEMTLSWEAICNAYCGETYGSTDLTSLEDVRNGILKMTYYWYNFMPLSRGTAIVGYTVLLGLFLAANMEITQNIPQGLQVDWEAILTSDLTSFIESIKIWMYPSLKITSCKDFPDIGATLATTGSVIASLSNYD
ncbi:Suppressor of RPS4-RLD 1 [Ranunculus cassubicifolius]